MIGLFAMKWLTNLVNFQKRKQQAEHVPKISSKKLEKIETAQEATQMPSSKPSISKEGSAESAESNPDMDNLYHVKWIGWNSQQVPIVTQNANGPCPMLAILNVLLLRGKMNLPEGCEIVSSEQLLEHLGN